MYFRKLSNDDICTILERHKRWFYDRSGGVRADFINADLSGAKMQKKFLRMANFAHANIQNANLRYVMAVGSDFAFADLRFADLRGARLGNANFTGANLTGAYLGYADLSGANFFGATIRDTALDDANLRFARNIIVISSWESDCIYGVRHHNCTMVKVGDFWGTLDEFTNKSSNDMYGRAAELIMAWSGLQDKINPRLEFP